MDKRFQVFISSTFRDLQEERQAVLRAVLELDHMPAGMELFPATDDGAWQLIRDVIDASDYYALIIGGRYGSLDNEGLGFTEKEYDYAVASHKPVIPLLHKAPDNLPRERTETDAGAWEKLKQFRAKVESRHTCVYWASAEDLKAKVIVGLTSTIKRSPAIGWIRADRVPTGATIEEVLLLREQVTRLQAQAAESLLSPPPGSEELLQGDDEFPVEYTFSALDRTTYKATRYKGSLRPTWDAIFGAVAPAMIDEASDATIRRQLEAAFESFARKAISDEPDMKGRTLQSFSFQDADVSTCIVQLRALGLMRESARKRSVKDIGTYWALTPLGDQRMVQLRALRRSPTRPTAGSVEGAAPLPRRRKKN